MRLTRVLLVIVAVVCFGVALSYPIRYFMAQKTNNDNMEQLSQLRAQAQAATPEAGAPGGGAGEEASSEPTDAGAQATQAAPAAPESGLPDGGDAPEGGIDVTVRPDGGSGAAFEAAEAADAVEIPADAEAAEAAQAAEAAGTSGTVEASEETARLSGESEGTTVARRADGMPVRATTSVDGTAEPVGARADESVATAMAATPIPTATPAPTATPVPTPEPTLDPYYWELTQYEAFFATATPEPTAVAEAAAAAAEPAEAAAGPTLDPSVRTGPLPYDMKEKVTLDESAILPELKDIYAQNHDLVGWLTIPDTVIDYPVVQNQENDYYLTHDFFGEENVNGQIILDAPCDPYTPSYNLVISGHHMKNGSMFGSLPDYYRTLKNWEQHKFLEFDTLMARKRYVVFAAFYSADYDEDEEGFRYNADIRYVTDAKQWLEEVRENQIYDTGIDAEFGDEFITLTTCNRERHRNGRFVVVCRRIREGETFE